MRDRISFFSSWYETLRVLPEEQRLPFLEAILAYGFEGVAPDFPDPMMYAIWLNIRPVLDSSNARIDGGAKGGTRGKKATSEATLQATPEATLQATLQATLPSYLDKLPSQATSVSYPSMDKEIEVDKEIEIETETDEDKKTDIDTPPTSPQGEVPCGTSTKSSRFVAPSVEQVRDFMAAFCAKQGYALEDNLADRFCDFYESKGWKVGRSPMKSWECTARNWCRDRGKSDTNVVNGITLGYDEHIDAQGQRYYISAKGKTIYIPADKRPRRKGEIWNAETNDWGFYD